MKSLAIHLKSVLYKVIGTTVTMLFENGEAGEANDNKHNRNLKEVTKIYEGKVMNRALNRLDFEAQEGEFVAVMGPSGSGKTTLLKLISTIDIPTYGKIMIDGVEPEILNAK